MEKKPVYDMQKKNRARTVACIRALISIYLISLAWNIVKDCYTGESGIELWIGVLIAAVFVLAAALYGSSTWKRYRQDLKKAEMTEEELAELREKYPDPVPEPVEYDAYLDDYLDEDDDDDEAEEDGNGTGGNIMESGPALDDEYSDLKEAETASGALGSTDQTVSRTNGREEP